MRQLRGDLALGITVHYTRLLMWFITLPNAAVSAFVVKLILVAWSATEVARYPMVLFPSSAGLKTFRYLMPLVTFPLGAGTEAFAAYTVAQVVRPRFARRGCSTPILRGGYCGAAPTTSNPPQGAPERCRRNGAVTDDNSWVSLFRGSMYNRRSRLARAQ